MAISMDELRAKFHKAVRDGNILAAEELAKQLNSQPSHEDAFICNITEKTWGPINMWHYMAPVVIYGKKSSDGYSITRITPHTDHIDLGEGKTLPVFIPARETAEDICRIFNNDIGEHSYSGFFVIENGETPTEQEVESARGKLEEFYKRLVNVADQEWDRGLKVNISDLHRSAGRYFKLNKPWLPDLRLKKECPVCAESIPASAASCKGCGAILDQELAAKYGLVKPKIQSQSAGSLLQAELESESVFAGKQEVARGKQHR